MDKLAVTGDSIVLQPVGFMWQGWDGKIPLQGANIITSEGKSVILEKDVMTAALQGMGKMYVAPPFATPGSVINLQLNVIPVTLSMSVGIQGQKVVTAATMGTYTASVVPAMNPQGVPDPLVTKMGQWTVQTTSQSSFRSGMPQPVPPVGDSDAKADGDPAEAEAKDHWVGITIEDQDGNPFANQIANIELSNGEALVRTLDDGGATRIGSILLDEDDKDPKCIVRLVFDPNRVPTREEALGFIAVQIVNDEGEPFAGRDVTLTLPSGEKRTATLDDLGRTRFANIPLDAKCQLDIVPGLTLFEFALVDEDGAPLAGKPYTVTDSTGKEYKGQLDDDGAASLQVYEGECDVSVDFTDQAEDGDADGAGDKDDADEDTDEELFTTTLTLTDLGGVRLKNWPVKVRMPDGEEQELSSDGDGLLTIKSKVEGELELSFAKERPDSAAPAADTKEPAA
ncbi:MAG TPA: hypothetical protein VHM70_18210 [Polyangiaceae bacterium]|jgi:hypothetical protein|nr:hypothetical protein [Polyangiaceae bacterium]